MSVLRFTLLFIPLFILASCAKETFDSTCLGFAKSHWSDFTDENNDHKALCGCVKKEIAAVSDEGKESIRKAMSASIVMRNRFDSEMNKAINNKTLTEDERYTYQEALGICLSATTDKDEEVNDMMEQFKALQ